MRCCAQFPSINIPDQETDDKHPNPSLLIHFHIYHLIERCTKHGRLTLTDKKNCRKCQQDTASGQSKYIYTIKELVMMETKISNFCKGFYIPAIQKLAFHIPHVKYWVRITVLTLAKLGLNSDNHFKICYVAVIMLRG